MDQATKYNIDSTMFVPQANFSARSNDNFAWTASQDYKVSTDYLNGGAAYTQLRAGTQCTALDNSIPSFWSFLRLQNWDLRREEGGVSVITVNFTGYWSAESSSEESEESSETSTTYSLNGTLEEASILEHPKITELDGVEVALLNALVEGRAIWNIEDSKICKEDPDTGELTPWEEQKQRITSPDAIEAANRIAKGVYTYKRPSFIWSETVVGIFPLSSSKVNSLGKIDEPAGNPPTPTGNRNWMLISASSTQTGTKNATITKHRDWLLSEREGHDSFLYQT